MGTSLQTKRCTSSSKEWSPQLSNNVLPCISIQKHNGTILPYDKWENKKSKRYTWKVVLSSAALLVAYQASFIGKTLRAPNTNERFCEEMIGIDMTSTQPVTLKGSATEAAWNGSLSCFMPVTYELKNLALSKSGIYTMKGPAVSTFGSHCTQSRCCQHTIIASSTSLDISSLWVCFQHFSSSKFYPNEIIPSAWS